MTRPAAGDHVTIRKYGTTYTARIVRVTPTRYLVSFMQRSGKRVQRWITDAELVTR